MGTADDAVLELVYVEFVGEPMASIAPAWAADLEGTAARAPGLRGVRCRLEHDRRRLLALLCWDTQASREAFRISPDGTAFEQRWARRGARTARSLWGPPLQSPSAS